MLKRKDIREMVDLSIDITYETFIKHVPWEKLREIFTWYDWSPGKSDGLRLKHDYMVSYSRSKYRGKPCYFITHSAIEYVFLQVKN